MLSYLFHYRDGTHGQFRSLPVPAGRARSVGFFAYMHSPDASATYFALSAPLTPSFQLTLTPHFSALILIIGNGIIYLSVLLSLLLF
jgi:hypothetical protein